MKDDRILLVVLGLLVFLPACQSNQNAQPSQDQSIDRSAPGPRISLGEIANVSWGSDTRAVQSRYGSPDRRNHPRDEKQVLAYVYDNQTFQGYPARRIFYFTEGDGLILVALKIPVGTDDDCLAMFESFSETISKANPSIEPKVYRENESEKPFCQAVREGDAHWERGWLLPTSGSMGVITLDPGATRVEMAFVSSTYRKYISQVRH